MFVFRKGLITFGPHDKISYLLCLGKKECAPVLIRIEGASKVCESHTYRMWVKCEVLYFCNKQNPFHNIC